AGRRRRHGAGARDPGPGGGRAPGARRRRDRRPSWARPAGGARRAGIGLAVLLAVLAGLAAAGCGPTGERAAARPPVLYVANALDGTVMRLDAAAGRVLGPPCRPARPRHSWRWARPGSCSSPRRPRRPAPRRAPA